MHIKIGFNFNTYSFHTDLTTTPGSGDIDLYSVALHEVTHALGFSSLINGNGNSLVNNPLTSTYWTMFSRYDTKLQTIRGTPLVLTDPDCTVYGAHLNPAFTSYNSRSNLDSLEPGAPPVSSCVSDYTDCATAIRFVGSTIQSVYTPNCFEPGSSLSHFEDGCLSPPDNNGYFVMCNSYGPGAASTKRSYTPEERLALCDIGYSVNNTYGAPADSYYRIYSGTTCGGSPVAGVDDGIEDGSYRYVVRQGESIQISGALSNDVNATKMSCVELCIGNGTVTNSGQTGFTYTPAAGFSKVDMNHILRYIPTDAATGKQGNITYIIVHVLPDECRGCAAQSVSGMIVNGGFETSAAGSCIRPFDTTLCWIRFGIYWPTAYSKLCNPAYQPSSGNKYINLTVRKQSSIATDSTSECIYTKLATPMWPGRTYQLQFDVQTNTAGKLQLYGLSEFPVDAYWLNDTDRFPAARFLPIGGPVTISNTSWQTETVNITPSGPNQVSYLMFRAAAGSTDLDEVRLRDITGTPLSTPSSASALLSYYGSTNGRISTSDVIRIDGTFNVNTSITFDNCPNIRCEPASKIEVAAGQTLSLLHGTTLGRECASTWKGIFASGSGSSIIMDGAKISNMDSGVDVTGNIGFSCKNSMFFDNAFCLVFRNAPASYSAVIDNNEFYTRDSARRWPHYMWPNNTQCAIRLVDCGSLTIGSLTGSGNRFHHLATGIYATTNRAGSTKATYDYKLYNNDFKQIYGPEYAGYAIPQPGPHITFIPLEYGAAVYIKSNGSGSFPANTDSWLTMDYSPGNPHRFDSCTKNINLVSCSGDIRNTKINGGWAVMADNADMRKFRVLNDSFTNVQSGVYVIGQPDSGLVQDNYISTKASPSGPVLTTLYGACGVGLKYVAGTTRTLPFVIDQNEILVRANSGRGIHIENSGGGVQAIRNRINMTPANLSLSIQNLYGVEIINARQTQLAGNHVDGNSDILNATHYRVANYHIESSPNLKLLCNYATSGQYGFLVDDNCNTASTNVMTNSFTDHKHGMYFRELAQTGTLGDIGSNSYDNRNEFNGTYTGTGSFRMYTLSSCPTNRQNRLYTTITPAITASGNSSNCQYTIQNNPGATIAPTCISQNYPLLPPDGNTVPDIAYAEQLALNQINFNIYQSGSTWLEQLHLYEQLVEDKNAWTGSATLNTFFANNHGTELGSISRINVLLDSLSRETNPTAFAALFQLATDSNNAMPLNNQQAINEQTINALYLKYLASGIDTLDATDSTTIAGLAMQCPFDAGTAVYTARGLYANYLPMLSYDGFTLCGLPEQSRPARADNSTNSTRAQSRQDVMETIAGSSAFHLYPNPTQDILHIEYEKAGTLEISDITGRRLKSVPLSNVRGGKTVIDLKSLPAGICVCRYYVDGQLREVRKVTLVHE